MHIYRAELLERLSEFPHLRDPCYCLIVVDMYHEIVD